MPPPRRRPRDADDSDDFDDRPRRRRPDDLDDFDDRPRRAKAANQQTVLLIVGGTVLASLLICGGVGLYVYRSMVRGAEEVRQQVTRAAEQAQAEAKKNVEKAQADHAKRRQEEESGDKAQATKLMEQFVAEVKADRLDAAYAFTTAAFQKRVTLADFQKTAGPLARGPHRMLHMRPDVFAPAMGTTYTFDGTAGGGGDVKVVVVREAGKWAVDRFTVTGSRFGGPDPDSDKGKATRVMEQFVADLKADRTEAAYKLTTADYQKRVPAADFKKAAGAVSGPTGRNLSMQADTWGPAESSTFTFENWGGWLTVKVTVVKDGDKWLVDRFSASRTVHGVDENSDKAKATELAERFVTEVKADRAEAAYKLTTPDYQKRVPLAEFRKLARQVGVAAGRGGSLHPDHSAPAAGTLYTFDLWLGLAGTGKVTVGGGEGKWAVDRFSVVPLHQPGGPQG